MNLVGKIFTVVIFLLCVVFGTFALMVNRAHKDWKAEVMDLNQKEIAATKLRDQLKVERQNLETALNEERERTKRRLVALENEKNMVVADQGSKERLLQDQERTASDLAEKIQKTNERISEMQSVIDAKRKAIVATVDDRIRLQKELVTKTDELMNAVNERQRLEKLGSVLQRTAGSQ